MWSNFEVKPIFLYLTYQIGSPGVILKKIKNFDPRPSFSHSERGRIVKWKIFFWDAVFYYWLCVAHADDARFCHLLKFKISKWNQSKIYPFIRNIFSNKYVEFIIDNRFFWRCTVILKEWKAKSFFPPKADYKGIYT